MIVIIVMLDFCLHFALSPFVYIIKKSRREHEISALIINFTYGNFKLLLRCCCFRCDKSVKASLSLFKSKTKAKKV